MDFHILLLKILLEIVFPIKEAIPVKRLPTYFVNSQVIDY